MAWEVEERFMQAKHLALERKELCVSQDKPSREESRSLLLNLPPKISRISLLRAKLCVAGKEKKKKNFYYPITAAAACCQQLPFFFVKCCHT